MKAVVINPDKSLRYGDVPDPVCAKDEVLIKVAYAALNRADLMQREGVYPPPPGAPDWPGLEVSGEVAACGAEATRFRPGDKVCALLGGGGYAQYVAVSEKHCLPVPKGLPMEQAAAVPEAFATAYLNLFIEGHALPGETLLMQAGKSGLASVVIPMAKAFGLRVITTVRGADAVRAISHLGADIIVDTRAEDLTEVLETQLKQGSGVDITVDCLGGENMGRCLRFLNHGARWIMIAALAGETTQIDLKNIYMRNIRIIGSTLRSRSHAQKAEIMTALEQNVWDKVASGQIRPTVYRIFSMRDAEQAQAVMQRGENVGKIVLKAD